VEIAELQTYRRVTNFPTLACDPDHVRGGDMATTAKVDATEEQARALVEESRETGWAKPAFAKAMLLARVRLDLTHPYPRSARESRRHRGTGPRARRGIPRNRLGQAIVRQGDVSRSIPARSDPPLSTAHRRRCRPHRRIPGPAAPGLRVDGRRGDRGAVPHPG